MPNDNEAMKITHTNTIEEALSHLERQVSDDTLILIKCGKNGGRRTFSTYWLNLVLSSLKGQRYSCPAYQLIQEEVVDSTGAGLILVLQNINQS